MDAVLLHMCHGDSSVNDYSSSKLVLMTHFVYMPDGPHFPFSGKAVGLMFQSDELRMGIAFGRAPPV